MNGKYNLFNGLVFVNSDINWRLTLSMETNNWIKVYFVATNITLHFQIISVEWLLKITNLFQNYAISMTSKNFIRYYFWIRYWLVISVVHKIPVLSDKKEIIRKELQGAKLTYSWWVVLHLRVVMWKLLKWPV